MMVPSPPPAYFIGPSPHDLFAIFQTAFDPIAPIGHLNQAREGDLRIHMTKLVASFGIIQSPPDNEPDVLNLLRIPGLPPHRT